MDIIKILSITLDIILLALLCRMVHDERRESEVMESLAIISALGATVVFREKPINMDMPKGYLGIKIPKSSSVLRSYDHIYIIWNNVAMVFALYEVKYIIPNGTEGGLEWNNAKKRFVPLDKGTQLSIDSFESDPNLFYDIFEAKQTKKGTASENII